MTILFDATRKHKANRFGQGILPTDSDRPAPTAEDLAWWAANSPTRSTGYEVVRSAEIDRRAAWAYAQDCLELGLIPSDVAEGLWATSLVGHDG